MSTHVIGRAAVRTSWPSHPSRERIFYGSMTLLMIAAILLGFRLTYFPTAHPPTALSSRIIVIHGLVFTLFLALFFVQVALIAARRVKWHMSLGLAVYGLAVLMIPLGVLAASDEIKRDLTTPSALAYDVDPETFSLVSVMGMVEFGSLMGWSYAVRRRPQAHKRLALYAVLSMMDAGIDRWPWATWGMTRSSALWVFTGFLLLPVVYDLITLKRLHWATAFAAPYVWVLHRLEIPLGQTHAWHVIAGWMLRMVR